MSKLTEPSFPTKSEFWGIRCEAGKRYSQVVKKPFHLTMAALDPAVRGKSTYVSLMVERGDRQYLLCNLKHDSILQVNLNLFFDVGERVTFSLNGEATVHLSGYHILSSGMAKENSKAVAKVPGATLNDIDLDDSSDDDDIDFEEIIAGEDLESEEEGDSDEDEEEDDEDVEEDDEDEEEESDEKETNPILKAQPAKNTPKKRHLEEDSDEDDSSEEDSSDGDDDVVEIVPNLKKTHLKTKKAKLNNASTPAQNNKVKNTPNKKMFDDNFDFDDGPAKGKKNPFLDDLNSSIGRTPMPKKSASVSFKETPGNKTPLKKEKQDGQSNQSTETANVQNTPPSTESKKKKKKKRKNKGDMDASGSPKVNENAGGKNLKKLPGGVEFEDLRVGHGLEAKKGKVVHMYYTGKLDSGHVFDSTEPGSKPFSFKLGSGNVIKGLELATQGMKVGGKRKIRIPPEMGYKNQRMGDIPPSSTLNFVVELKAVS